MIKFGTGGFRAIIGDDFIRSNVDLLTQGLVNKMVRENVQDSTVIIGYDRRFLSDISARWAAEVFAGNGIKSQIINYDAPTPIIMFEVKRTKAKYGMAVTASHNPAEYNGIKVFTEGGRGATETVTNDIEAEIAKITSEDVKHMELKEALACGLVEYINPMNPYLDSILSVLDQDKIKERNLRILLDPMFGVSKSSLQTVLLTCRCSVDVINDRHDAVRRKASFSIRSNSCKTSPDGC